MITAILSKLTGVEVAFAICVVVGGLFFLIRLVMMLFVGSLGADADLDADMDTGDGGLRLLSLSGLSAGLLMFGLVGLALSINLKAGAVWSTLGGVAAGAGMMWITAVIFSFMYRLQSSGTVSLESAVGSEGTVYLTIPAQETGKVQVTVQGRLRTYGAVADDKEAIATGERVKVTRVVSGNVLVVEKL